MLVDAAKAGLTRVCEIALLQGADVNARVSFLKKTALMDAVSGGHVDTCLMLLKQGADPNIQNNQGNNAMMCAWMCRRLEAGMVVLAYGGIALDGPGLVNQFSGSLKVGNVDLAKISPAMAAMRAGLTDRLSELVMDESGVVSDEDLQSLMKYAKKSGRADMAALMQSVIARRQIEAVRQDHAPGR